jgi:TonB family protein
MRVYRVAWVAFALTACFARLAPSNRVRVSESVAQRLLTKKVDPVYPQSAQSSKIQGTVVVQLEISKSGGVQYATLVSGDPLLAPAAIEAVKQWKYKPYLLNDSPVEMETTVRVTFTLDEEAAPGSESGGIAGAVPGSVPADQLGVMAGVISSPPQLPRVATPMRVRVSQGAMRALLITKVNPDYPPEAKAQHVQGMVVLRVNIDKDGNVYKAENVSGPPLLVPTAIEAVKQWKYKPFLLNQKPVEVETMVQINFTLSGS